MFTSKKHLINILITGCAGFIGFHLVNKLILTNKKIRIVGIDNLNNYYSKKLKTDRLKVLKKIKGSKFIFYRLNLLNHKKLNKIFDKYKFNYIIHLAAQPGVRYSIENPRSYINANLNGFFNIIDLARIYKVEHFIYASTSSVYGNSSSFPIKENFDTTKPISLYAATKKSNELIAHSYANIFKLPSTALRFFTVYGPFGRPDMSLFNFTKNILNRKNIFLFNKGKHKRDFTYVEDCVVSIIKLIKKIPKGLIPYRVVNIGSGKSKNVISYLREIEKILKIKSKVKKISLQRGDIYKTHSNINLLFNITGYKPQISIKEGIKKFIQWYKNYYKIKIL